MIGMVAFGASKRTMRSTLLLIILTALLAANATVAQDLPQLIFLNIELGTQPDGFGGETPVVTGELFNHGAEAYANINITAEAFDADEELIGEGFGYLVNACGTALLNYALPPGGIQAYSVPYEIFAEGEVATVKMSVDADASAPDLQPLVDLPAVRRVAFEEVVMLEWLDDENLIYGVGCEGAVFTELKWWRYNLPDHALSEIKHPDAMRVTPEMIELTDATLVSQSGERNPELFYSSQMTFSPSARRIVYQNDLHSIYSAEPDGSYRRLIHRNLHRHSLRGFQWARNPGIFLAYYFGSYGEPVYYFISNVDGQMLSGWLEDLPPSLIVPGPAPDGFAAVVGRREAEISGYYWQHIYGSSELLFEAELPGNNYPAPIVTRELIYVFRSVDGEPTLQCYGRRSRALKTVTALPLQLTREARAWAWLSPDGGKLALAANGTEGGLWWVELAGGC